VTQQILYPRLNSQPDRRVALLVLADVPAVQRTVASIVANRTAAGQVVTTPEATEDAIGLVRIPDPPEGEPSDVLVTSLGTSGALLADDALDVALTCREVIVVATGRDCRAALEATLADPPSRAYQCSLLRSHQRLTVIADESAAGLLELGHNWDSDHVIIVLGHRQPGLSLEHRISGESLDRLHRAERLTRGRAARAIILTGYSSTGGLSEAEQMAVQWVLPGVPRILEVAGRTTAENASCSLPLILALGGVRRVTVVTSAWHLRTRYFFAPYRRYGVDLEFHFTWRSTRWAERVAAELSLFRRAPAARRKAFAAMELGIASTRGWIVRLRRSVGRAAR
jgi:hypothetical protein